MTSVMRLSVDTQLRKMKDVPRILQRLRVTLGSIDVHDFSLLLERCGGLPAPTRTSPFLFELCVQAA